jgi:hypothetical protein
MAKHVGPCPFEIGFEGREIINYWNSDAFEFALHGIASARFLDQINQKLTAAQPPRHVERYPDNASYRKDRPPVP